MKCYEENNNCKLRVWLALINVSRQPLVSNEELQSETLQAFFDAVKKRFLPVLPGQGRASAILRRPDSVRCRFGTTCVNSLNASHSDCCILAD